MLRLFMLLLTFGIYPLAGLLPAQTTRQPAGDRSNGALEMTVEAAKPKLGEAGDAGGIRGTLTITIKNVSNETLSVILTNPECDYAAAIRDADGISPKLTSLGERLLPKTDAERATCPVLRVAEQHLRPGVAITEYWDLNRLFYLEPSKSYGITVARVKGLPASTTSGRPLRKTLSQTLSIK